MSTLAIGQQMEPYTATAGTRQPTRHQCTYTMMLPSLSASQPAAPWHVSYAAPLTLLVVNTAPPSHPIVTLL